MKFGIDLPNTGVFADARLLAELAHEAEECGWEGVFLWDSVYVPTEDPLAGAACDPWIALSAMAMRTSRLRLGTMITPPARRRPWKLARETATLDRLCNGRLTLPVGLGAVEDGAFSKTGEPLERKVRAQKLDESLEILDGLWSGEPFRFEGRHYHMEEMTFLPRPVQQPRIPVWVVGAWNRPLSMQRALRWDGILPFKMAPSGESLAQDGNALAGGMSPLDVQEMKAYIDAHRTSTAPFDIVLEGEAPADPGILLAYAQAGATWWLEAVWKAYFTSPLDPEPLRERIRRGPVIK